LGRQQLECNQEDQEAHLENSQSRLREPPGAVERCSRSSYDDDEGRTQGGKSTATHRPEFQMANNFHFDHVTFDIYCVAASLIYYYCFTIEDKFLRI